MACAAAGQVGGQSAAASPPAAASGRSTYKPSSFAELVLDASKSVSAAVADGVQRMEVEFPPLPNSTDGEQQECCSHSNQRSRWLCMSCQRACQ